MAPQPFYQNRGTPIAVRLLATELARLGHRVDLLVFHEGEDVEIPGVIVHRTVALPGVKNIPPSISWKKIVCDVGMFFKAMAMQRRHHYDVIHAVEESAFMALFYKKLFKIRYVYDMDSSLAIQIVDKLTCMRPLQPVLEFFEKAAVRQSCGAVAVCKALEDIALDYAADKDVVRLEDISLLDTGVNCDESLRQKYGIRGPIMLYVGNLEGYQGIDLLLDSFQVALERGCQGNVVIIGGTPETVSHYTQYAKTLGIDSHTFFCGPRPVQQLGCYLAQADILLSPRIQGNNTPMKLYSYLGSGKVVLATSLPTHTQVLTEKFACLVEPDKAHMAEGMIRLLRDPELRCMLGAKGKEIAEEQYSLVSFQNKLAAFYARIASRPEVKNS